MKSMVILMIFFAIIIGIVLFFSFIENSKKNKTEFENLEMLTDTSLFFSVSKNINKLYDFLGSNSSESVLDILDKDYITNNKLNINNVVDYFGFKDENVRYYPVDMYVIGKNNYLLFYVNGYIKNDDYSGDNKIIDEVSFIVNYDIDKYAFTLELIDKKKYDKFIKNGGHKFKEISSNNNNFFDYESINDENLAVIYFNDFYNNVVFNTKYAYDLITRETKNEYFSSYNAFSEKIKNGLFDNLSLKEYGVEDDVYKCRDNKGNIYLFAAPGVMNYHVKIEFAK